MMASAGQLRDRKEYRRLNPAKPRRARGEAVIKVAAPSKIVDAEMDGRDGLIWLKQKGRLVAEQISAALWVSDLIRDAGDVALRSCLDDTGGGGSATARSPSPLVSQTSARRELLVVRWVVLRGQADMILVVDGVCGARHTLRYLAGGDKHRARDLEVALKLALDQIAAFRKEPKTGA
jgi:hypothetical protein